MAQSRGELDPQPDSPDMYRRLGVARDASDAQIKAAYRALARALHPDQNPDPRAAEQFHHITEAYSYLADPSNRGVGAADPTGRSSVSDALIMVLLAEVKVGSVGDHFDAVAMVTLVGADAPQAPGLICLGQTGLAFVYRLSQAELKKRPDRAVVPIDYHDITSLHISDSEDGLSTATLTATNGRRMVIKASSENVDRLRNRQVEFRADNVAMPSLRKTSLLTKFRGMRLKRRKRKRLKKQRRKDTKPARGFRLPTTNGWWIVGAVVIAVVIIGAAALVA